MNVRIVDGTNPQACKLEMSGYPELNPFFQERGAAPRVVYLSREDCSELHPYCLSSLEREAFNSKPRKDQWAFPQRAAVSAIVASFCPRKAVSTLIDRGVSRDFHGYIITDHELPAWLSALHFSAYAGIADAIRLVFPKAKLREYAGKPVDWVLNYSKPDRSHELEAMYALARSSPIDPIPCFYIHEGYFDDREKFRKIIRDNITRLVKEGRFDCAAVSPIVQGTFEAPNWTAGQMVPPDVMAILIGELARAGITIVVWMAYSDQATADATAILFRDSIIPAVAIVESEKH